MNAPTLRVDHIACAGHGVCADLFPDWIRLDDWGFPIINAAAIPPDRLAEARWAVANCPALALVLEGERYRGRGGSSVARRPDPHRRDDRSGGRDARRL